MALNIVVLSPSKKLRRKFVKFLIPEKQMKQSKTAMSLERFERTLSCGSRSFVLRMLEMQEFTFLSDLFENDNVHLIVMVFSFDAADVSEREHKFMKDLAQWMESSGHWQALWKRTLRVLDYALHNYKKNRKMSLTWTCVDTEVNSKLKFEGERLFKFGYKWPYLPVDGIGHGQDWRVQMISKLFTILDEPHRSYFLTAALNTPNRNLMPKDFEEIAKKTVQNGPSPRPSFRTSRVEPKRDTLSNTQSISQALVVTDCDRNESTQGTDTKRHTLSSKSDTKQTPKPKSQQPHSPNGNVLPKIQSELSQDETDDQSVLSLKQTKSPSDIIASVAEENLSPTDDRTSELKSHQITFQHIRKKSSKHLDKEKDETSRLGSRSSPKLSPVEIPSIDSIPFKSFPKKKFGVCCYCYFICCCYMDINYIVHTF
ncbi:hypothetical protein RFI_25466 [Reticulomyxa filosa]|uniref:Uncharacterized protein n=1 Tax=Reticulomyxa filosa TaxID=46433 RepID=X6MFW0_RETFI|nr:hypothetical protein RFI_25466 [Reticulomyxa filosa]|eukprot:ETO11910.1 hypothetical protein RFI_25466 [Reticulomyxa filosa]